MERMTDSQYYQFKELIDMAERRHDKDALNALAYQIRTMYEQNRDTEYLLKMITG